MADPATRVLVTGASGFLGGHLVHELREHGFDVWGAGRSRKALEQTLPEGRRVLGDLEEMARLTLPVDTVIHCAALSAPWGPWRDFLRSNVEGTSRVVEFCRRNGVRRLVHVSSPSIYAAPRHRIGIREEEVDERNRLNGYIRSKIMAERVVSEALRDGALTELVIIRPRGLVGPGDPSLVPRLMDVNRRIGVPMFGGGRHPVDVTAVENVALALRLAVSRGDAAGGVYNITNADPRPFRSLLERLTELLGESLRVRRMNRTAAWGMASVFEAAYRLLPGHPEPPLTRYTMTTIAYAQTLDISRARAELGYVPRVSLDDALERVAQDMKDSA